MALEAQRLFDALVRLQIYVEAVKVGQAKEFAEVIKAVDVEFRKLIGRLEFDSLDQMTKRELYKVTATLRQSQLKIFSNYTTKLLKRLHTFTQASALVHEKVFAVATDKRASIPTIKTLWAKVNNDPIPATGALLKPFIASLAGATSVGTENLIRKGYSNSWTLKQTTTALEAQLEKSNNQAFAVESTVIQHANSVVSATLAGALFGYYFWMSIIDGGTTDICIHRNRHRYSYSNGPLPPAHYKCRSFTVPDNDGGQIEVVSLAAFLKTQSKRVRSLADGAALTIEEFADSAEEIITG